MSDAVVVTHVEKRIVTQVGFHYPEFLVDINNAPEDQHPKRVAYMMLGGKSSRSTLGAKWDRHVGVLQIDVIVPDNAGNGERDEVCDFLADVFNEYEATLTGDVRLRFKVPSQRDFGSSTGESKKIISVPYWVDVPKR